MCKQMGHMRRINHTLFKLTCYDMRDNVARFVYARNPRENNASPCDCACLTTNTLYGQQTCVRALMDAAQVLTW
jgi:hypothetical protein